MKKIIFLFIFIPSISFSQLGWVLLQSGTTQALHSLVILDSNTVFAVGDNGTFLKTTNGGANFSQPFIGTNNSLYGIYFPTNLTGYIVTSGGNAFVKTTNRGMNWNLYPTTPLFMPSLYFTDDNTGYVTSYEYQSPETSYIFKTTNGGMNWLTSYFESGIVITSIYFTGSNNGFAGSNLNNQGYLLKTTNSGSNWLILNSLPNNGNVNSVFFINASTGHIAGRYIMKTTNSGIDWEIEFGSSAGTNFYSIFFVDINTGYAVGINGNIAKTSNGGLNWNFQQNLVTSNLLTSIKFFNSEIGYAVGDNGTIIKTTTGGIPVGIEPKGKETPEVFALFQNYPNPFNPKSNIKFQIAKLGQC